MSFFPDLQNKIKQHIKAEQNQKEKTPAYIWMRAMSPISKAQENSTKSFEQVMASNNKKEDQNVGNL